MVEQTIRASDGLELSVVIAEARETRGLVQIIHGAKEHKGRYKHFIKKLNDHGFTVITSDNRGHGKSVSETYPLGYMDGFHQIIDDQFLLSKHIKSKYPGKELYVFGHSLGSVFARIFLQKHDANVQKVILSGTVNYVPGIDFGIILGKLITAISGKHGYNNFLEQLSFKNLKDDLWISASEKNLENYRNDPFCQYDYQNNTVLTMLRAVKELHHFKAFQCNNPTLPILSISGVDDPMTGGKKGLTDSIESLERVGYTQISNIVYPGMRHEVLQEDDWAVVYQDVIKFLAN